jgi:hypothetical protein
VNLQAGLDNLHEDAHLAGCCGLYCGLCPRYQSTAPSRCPSCHKGEHHSYCSVYRCCVTKRGLVTCAECTEYPCERLLRVIGVDLEADSFISHKPAIPNLERIREVGLDLHLDEQRGRRLIAEYLLAGYNDGRSMTFYCTACTLMPVELIRSTVNGAGIVSENRAADAATHKARAKAMRAAIQTRASEAGIDLRLRRKR